MSNGISGKLSGLFLRMAKEPPFRLISRSFVKYFSTSIRSKLEWDAVARPHYLMGILQGADQARAEGINEICVIEFGVAAGNGLLEMQKYAAEVEKTTGIGITVYGFDNGKGLPQLCGDYRDHPDQWMPLDYPMNEELLRSKLSDKTKLYIGNVADTLQQFVENDQIAPAGFISFDLDLYSSTKEAFKVLTLPRKRLLRRTPLYFDDIDFFFNHKYAGELLAIEEFNSENEGIKIDIWRGLSKNRIFPENFWIDRMYVAHDLRAIDNTSLGRSPAEVATSSF